MDQFTFSCFKLEVAYLSIYADLCETTVYNWALIMRGHLLCAGTYYAHDDSYSHFESGSLMALVLFCKRYLQ